MKARDWNEPSVLLLTLTRPPSSTIQVTLLLQGVEVPREKWNLLHNRDTNDYHVYVPDATWGDCCQAQIRYDPVPRSRSIQ